MDLTQFIPAHILGIGEGVSEISGCKIVECYGNFADGISDLTKDEQYEYHKADNDYQIYYDECNIGCPVFSGKSGVGILSPNFGYFLHCVEVFSCRFKGVHEIFP